MTGGGAGVESAPPPTMSRAPSSHPCLTKLRRLSASLPEATEVEAWGHPTFRAGKKIFATFGERDGRPTIGCKSTHADQGILTTNPGFFVPKYVGKHGWIGIWADAVEWDIIAELVETSYRMVALKRMVKALDAM